MQYCSQQRQVRRYDASEVMSLYGELAMGTDVIITGHKILVDGQLQKLQLEIRSVNLIIYCETESDKIHVNLNHLAYSTSIRIYMACTSPRAAAGTAEARPRSIYIYTPRRDVHCAPMFTLFMTVVECISA